MGFNDILKYIQKILCDLERRLKIVESQECECDGSEIDQDNLPLTIYVLFGGDATLDNMASAINGIPAHTIGEKDILNYVATNFAITLVPGVNPAPPITYRLRIKRKGKGDYGQGGIQLIGTDLELLSTALLSSEELSYLPNTQTIDLGEIGNTNVDIAMDNYPIIETGDPSSFYIKILTLVNGVPTDYSFIGPPGFYGFGGLTTIPEYFVPIPASIVDTVTVPYWNIQNSSLTNLHSPLEIKDENGKKQFYVGNTGVYSRGNAEGNWNLAYGEYSLMNITTGNYNTIYGDYAGYGLTTGVQNLYIGSYSGWQATSGSRNTGIGVSALQNNIAGSSNTAIGNWALRNTLGGFNIAIGAFAGAKISTGTNNIIIGSNSIANNAGDGTGPTTGSNNTLVGTAKPGIEEGNGNTVIGNPGEIMDAKSTRHVIISDGLGGIAVEKRGVDKPLKSPNQTIALIDTDSKSLITKEYFDAGVPGIGTISPLQTITEGGNTGIAIRGRNPDSYGNIGQNAIDLSYNNNSSITQGATGENSFAQGYRTTSSGKNSYSQGDLTLASGENSSANGQYTIASGKNSHVIGQNNTASGESSHAEGRATLASGKYSYVNGHGNKAQSYSETVIGHYALDLLANNSLTKDVGDYTFRVGIGTTAVNMDAFQVKKDGLVTVPEQTTALINANPKAVMTKETADLTYVKGSMSLLSITQTDYNAIVTKDPNTLYIII